MDQWFGRAKKGKLYLSYIWLYHACGYSNRHCPIVTPVWWHRVIWNGWSLPWRWHSATAYLVHISNISSKDLQNINNSAPMEQAYNKAVSPIHVRYLYGRCTVDVRYESGHVPDKYRTYSGQRQEMHRRYAGATIWIEWRYAWDMLESNMRCFEQKYEKDNKIIIIG